ncbi:MAG: glycogen synthase GlgA [Candidatus Fermentithermobacillus carboniphilus]|uniref:Glycogen synthase n=1 Tax=Candidatus Fermentithermobacillus carboniphilus TaxID=3085328 RepID=A0AAT9LBJ9_9FIRM|nr:MAG: glycogen synthase GlgA [Candidatus Fermentithermobacillus carboniphilus]
MLDTGLKILLVASEVAPFAKTGGLADVAGSLPKALLLQGNDVRVVLPRYRSISGFNTIGDFPVQVGPRKETCIVRTSQIEAKSPEGVRFVPVYFLDNYHYFDRERYYMFPDEAERFAFFDLACLKMCEALNFIPDVVHCNDWQTGFIPLLIKERARNNPVWEGVASCFTIHNLRYQGNFPRDVLYLLGLGQEYFHPEAVEFYGQVSFMKAGIMYADVINTVSVTYSREIQTPEYGEGLDGVLRKRAKDLYGIINGINYHEFDPKTDPRIFKNFGPDDLEVRKENKYALQREVGLPISDKPLIGVVSRLVDQKGLDILLEAMPSILSLDVEFILLGTGDKFYEEAFSALKKRYPDRVAVFIGFNGVLAQRIYAGSDIFVMPSRFEPCGLGHLIAMRYGSIPIVRKTGGLRDTVMDYDRDSGTGNGFVFEEYSAEALTEAVRRAVSVYRDAGYWQRLVRDTMGLDFSWNKSAALYTELYLEALGRKRRVERPA